MERDAGLQKASVVFPFLIEEPKPSHQDAMNQSFLKGVMTKWSNHRRPSRPTPLVKDAFPPSKNVLHGRERCLKGFHSTRHKDITSKCYSCPNIVDMSNIIFYHDRVMQHEPRRIINGFFPNKIRSAQGGLVNDYGASQNRGRTAAQSQVGMCLGRKDSTNLTGLRASHKPHSPTTFHGPSSKSTTGSHPDVEHFNGRRSHSSWPVRNGSPSPWLQRYKIKKRATTSYALKKSGQDCSEEGTDVRPKRSQEYVNLSSAVILDAF